MSRDKERNAKQPHATALALSLSFESRCTEHAGSDAFGYAIYGSKHVLIAHRFHLTSDSRSTRTIGGATRVPLVHESDHEPFFTTSTWRKLKLAWLLHVALAPAPCRKAQAWLTPKLSGRVDSR